MDVNNIILLHGLYGSKIERTKAIGYCHKHKAALTARTLKGHECLRKQCNYLKKYEEHTYWTEREILKARKKEKRRSI